MNIAKIAIHRPVFTVMVTFALVVLGVVGYSRLGTDLFPDVSFPFVVVNIPYPGAAPSEVEERITKPVEDAVVSLNGIDRVRTFSREGLSTVFVMFKLEKDLQEGATEVRERVAQVRYKLPTDVLEPAVSRFDVGATPVLIYTVRGEGLSLAETQKFTKDVIKPALEQVEGVASVEVRGGADREIGVFLDLSRIDALGLSPQAIFQALRRENLNLPAGHYSEGVREITVRTMGEFRDVASIRNLIVATASDGSSVRLSDVATVKDGHEKLRTKIRANGAPAVSFDVVKQSGQNTVEISRAAKKRLSELEKTFPPGIKAALILDQATHILQNAHEVEVAIVFGGAMAILVILIFMLDLRSTLISAVALPTSVVATFFLMYVLNFTLNMMTLLALSLAIGLLIDDAVVVRENISKHLERGVDPRTAAEKGTEEIALSVLATTLTIVAVFVPVAFTKGLVGQFFRQFGLTIAAAVVVSLFVAFTLDPMLSSRFSKAHTGGPDRWMVVKKPFLHVLSGMDHLYRDVLTYCMQRKWLVGLVAVLSLVFMGFVGGLMGSEFVAAEDRGQFLVELEFPPGTSLEETERLSLPAEEELLADKDFRTVLSTVGQNGDSNKVKWRIVTTSKTMRTRGIEELKEETRKVTRKLQVKASVADVPFLEGAATEAPIMVQVRAERYEELEPLAREFEKALRRIPGIVDVQMKFASGQPELRIVPDRDRAAAAKVPLASIATTLRLAMEGEEASKFRDGKDEIPIRVRLRDEDRESAGDLLRLSLWTPGGRIALGDVAKTERGEGPSVIEREDRVRQIVLWATPRGRSLGELVPDMKAAFAQIPMPKGGNYYFDGQIRQMNESNASLGLAFALGLIFIYIVLASQFESFIHPATIMLTLPLALVGAIIALFLSGSTMAIGAQIGIILLMGLVTKNAILLLDRAIVRVREQGETPLQAILEAGPERLRPILMTSAAMILGMLPTALSQSEGSEFRAPMAIAVIGGVISSTLLSLLVIPAFYLAIEWVKEKLWKLIRALFPGQRTQPRPAE